MKEHVWFFMRKRCLITPTWLSRARLVSLLGVMTLYNISGGSMWVTFTAWMEGHPSDLTFFCATLPIFASFRNSDRDHRMQQIQGKCAPWPVEIEDHNVFCSENNSWYVWSSWCSCSGLSVPTPASIPFLGSVMEGGDGLGFRAGSTVSLWRNVGSGWEEKDPSRNYI